jgi:hypothetical protein
MGVEFFAVIRGCFVESMGSFLRLWEAISAHSGHAIPSVLRRSQQLLHPAQVVGSGDQLEHPVDSF